MKVNSKVIVVTGAGAGIGRELTLALLAKGARVAAVDINREALQETAALAGDIKDRVSLHKLDITDRTAVEKFPAEVIKAHGQVDGLINNAGVIQPFVKFKDLPYADIERMINVNFFGTVNMTKALLPRLLARPEGHIANIISMGGFLPVPGQSIYGASKAAQKLFTEALFAELAGTGVKVTVVFPGAINTNIAANSGVKIHMSNSGKRRDFKTLPAADAAARIIEGIERDSFRVLVGSDARMMDLLYRLAPKQAVNLIARQMGSLLSD